MCLKRVSECLYHAGVLKASRVSLFPHQLNRCARAGDFGNDQQYRNYFDLQALRPYFFGELNDLLQARDTYARW